MSLKYLQVSVVCPSSVNVSSATEKPTHTTSDSIGRGNELLCFCYGRIRILFAMATNSSHILTYHMGKENIDNYSVSIGVFEIKFYRSVFE